MIVTSANTYFVNDYIGFEVSGTSLSGTGNLYQWYLYSQQLGYHYQTIDIDEYSQDITVLYPNHGLYYPAVRTVRTSGSNSFYQANEPLIINPIPKIRYDGTSLVNDSLTFYDLRSEVYANSSISATSINFGDGTIITSAGTNNSFVHSYLTSGSYSVSLSVTDINGHVATNVVIVEILDTVNGTTSANYITLLGPDVYRHEINKVIDLKQFLPNRFIDTNVEQYLEVFEDYLNEMFDGSMGITTEETIVNSTYLIGSTYTLYLTNIDVDYIDIEVSRDGGLSYDSLVNSAAVSHYTSGLQEIYEPFIYDWIVEGPVSHNCIIRVKSSEDETVYFLQNVNIDSVEYYYDSINFVLPEDTMKISILEKIKRLSELQDPELIDLEYIQYFAKNLGYSVDITRNDIAGDSFGNLGTLDNNASNEADQRKYLRFVIENLPNWYKIKTTKNCISIMLYSFGLIGDLVELYTKDYSNDKTDWNINDIEHLDNSWYPTSHFAIMINIDTSVNIINDIDNKNSVISAIESIKPINTVFEKLSGKLTRYCNLYISGLTRFSRFIRIQDSIPSDYFYI